MNKKYFLLLPKKMCRKINFSYGDKNFDMRSEMANYFSFWSFFLLNTNIKKSQVENSLYMF